MTDTDITPTGTHHGYTWVYEMCGVTIRDADGKYKAGISADRDTAEAEAIDYIETVFSPEAQVVIAEHEAAEARAAAERIEMRRRIAADPSYGTGERIPAYRGDQSPSDDYYA